MTPFEYVVGAVIGAIVTLIGGYLTYRLNMQSKLLDTEAEERDDVHTSEQAFLITLVTRVEKLEERTDTLQDKIKQAEEERRKIINEYELKVEALRIEMRKLVDNATIELATWRDRYFKLVEDYNNIKSELTTTKILFERLDSEYKALKLAYDERFRVLRRADDVPYNPQEAT